MMYICLSIFLVIALWSIITCQGIISPFFLPTPNAIIQTLIEMFIYKNLLRDVMVSFYRIGIGFLLSLTVSIPAALLMGINKKIYTFLFPLASFVRYIPVSAIVPLFILWFGIGDLQKVLIIFVGVAPYLSLLILDVIAQTKQEFIDTALTLGAKRSHILYKVIIPQSLPGIWDAMRIMIGGSWLYLVLAEIVAAESGLGHIIITSQRFLQTAQVIAVVLLIGLFGIIVDYLFTFLGRLMFPWHEKHYNDNFK